MEDFIVAAVKVVIAFAFLFGIVLLLVWAERRIVAFMQNRIGPNRAGPIGILQTLSLIHISEPTRPNAPSRMPSSA